MAIPRPLGATSRVIFELKPFGVSIMGANGSQLWVGRSTAQMSGNPNNRRQECPGHSLDKMNFVFVSTHSSGKVWHGFVVG